MNFATPQEGHVFLFRASFAQRLPPFCSPSERESAAKSGKALQQGLEDEENPKEAIDLSSVRPRCSASKWYLAWRPPIATERPVLEPRVETVISVDRDSGDETVAAGATETIAEDR